MATKVKRSELIKVAKELNEVLGCDPPIDVSAKADEIEKGIVEAAKLIDWENDDFTDETVDVLESLGLVEDENDNDEPEEDDASNDTAEDDDDDIPLEERVAATRKLTDLKALVEEHDEFKKLRKKLGNYKGLAGSRELKAAMFKALGVEPTEKPAPTPATKRSGPPVKKHPKWKTAIELIAKNPEITAKELVKKMSNMPCGAFSESVSEVYVRDITLAINIYKKHHE